MAHLQDLQCTTVWCKSNQICRNIFVKFSIPDSHLLSILNSIFTISRDALGSQPENFCPAFLSHWYERILEGILLAVIMSPKLMTYSLEEKKSVGPLNSGAPIASAKIDYIGNREIGCSELCW